MNEEELYTEMKQSAEKIFTDIPSLNARLALPLDQLYQMHQKASVQTLPFTRLADI